MLKGTRYFAAACIDNFRCLTYNLSTSGPRQGARWGAANALAPSFYGPFLYPQGPTSEREIPASSGWLPLGPSVLETKMGTPRSRKGLSRLINLDQKCRLTLEDGMGEGRVDYSPCCVELFQATYRTLVNLSQRYACCFSHSQCLVHPCRERAIWVCGCNVGTARRADLLHPILKGTAPTCKRVAISSIVAPVKAHMDAEVLMDIRKAGTPQWPIFAERRGCGPWVLGSCRGCKPMENTPLARNIAYRPWHGTQSEQHFQHLPRQIFQF